MRAPEVARAIPELVRRGVLPAEKAAPWLAVARGDLLSVRAELRALLGLGVASITAGLGLLLARHHERVGPVTIAAALAVAAAVALGVALRRAPPFGRGRAPEADWTVDGLLLLAVGLLGAELAWIETQLGALGEDWPWHLLIVSLVSAALAVRCDSLVVWTLALSTFAAWRGVAVAALAGRLERALWSDAGELRFNLLVCGLVFWIAACVLERRGLKRHFEPATIFLAALAASLALATGLGDDEWWFLWALTLATLGGLTARHALARRRLALFALGALALYAAVTRGLFELPGASGLGCFWFALSSLGAVALLLVVHRRLRSGEAR